MAGARYIRWHFAARRADCAAASSSQAHRRAAVSRRRRLDGEGARRATITWLQMAPPNDAEHMLTILLFFNRRADGARPVHSIRSGRPRTRKHFRAITFSEQSHQFMVRLSLRAA